MIEIIVKDFLKKRLHLPVVLELQPDPPARCILIERTGGGERGRLCLPTLAVQSYGATLQQAAEINEQVKAAMRDLTSLPEVCRCSLNTDYNFTDPASKRYRYQAVFDITHYREE